MESTRRLVIAAVLGIVVIAAAAASDFVFGSFWVAHAMLTALIASLLVLAVTVVVLNEWLGRRDRRRWSVLAQYVLFQLVQAARASWIGLVELIGEVELQTGSTDGLLAGARIALDTDGFAASARAMLADPERRRVLQEMFVILAAHGRGVLTDWAAVMVGAGPYAGVFDRHVELQARLDWIAATLSHNEPTQARTFHETKLARSSVAAEHADRLDDQWLHRELVSTTQLAIRLDYDSRKLGFELVSFEWWAERSRAILADDGPFSG
jgi:hypothetical protein